MGYIVNHPENLEEGKTYEVIYATKTGKLKNFELPFRNMGRNRGRLYMVFGNSTEAKWVPWCHIRSINLICLS